MPRQRHRFEFEQKQLSRGFKASEVRPEAVPSDLAEVQHRHSLVLLDQGSVGIAGHLYRRKAAIHDELCPQNISRLI